MSCNTCHGQRANLCPDTRHKDEDLGQYGMPYYWTPERIVGYEAVELLKDEQTDVGSEAFNTEMEALRTRLVSSRVPPPN